jgi:hypothetical protein
MSTSIPIGRVGRIVQGDDVGAYVKVVDDRANSGGFLILLGSDAGFEKGSDGWVENLETLAAYFKESSWQVEWFDNE